MGIGVHVEMLRRAAYACRPLVLIGIPAAITLAALVDRAPVANLIGFVVLVTAFALLAVVALTHLLDVLRRRDGDAGPATRAAVLGLVMPGMVWPLALVVLTPRTIAQTLVSAMLYTSFLSLNRMVAQAQLSEANARLVHRATHDDLTASRTVPCSATSSTTGSPSSSLVALRPRCSTST